MTSPIDPPRRSNGVRRVRRSDDAEDTVRRRIAVYHDNTEPLVARYRRAGTLVVVDAAQATPDEVFAKIGVALAEKGVVSAP